MNDDEAMLTPAQKYKRALTSLSGEERAIMRLEHRWNKNLPKWNKATTYIQKIIRGYIERSKMAIIKDGIRIQNMKQECVAIALSSLKSKKFQQALTETEEALRLDPNSCESYRIRGHAKIALALEMKKQINKQKQKQKREEEEEEEGQEAQDEGNKTNINNEFKQGMEDVKNAYIGAINEYSKALKLNENHIEVS